MAIVHDFFVTEGGADRCAIEFSRLLPDARVFTSFFDAQRFGDRLAPERVHTWPLQRVFGPTRRFRSLLPLYPVYFSFLDLGSPELVLSSSIAFAKAVRRPRGSMHISYVHTPLRYAWDLDTYLQGSSYGLPARVGAQIARPILRRWDRATASRPDVVVANSRTVQDRIRKLWGRESEVVYPPVDIDEISMSNRDDGYLLIAARLLAYRRVDLAVQACRLLRRRLVVVGDGPEVARLRALAGPETSFEGHVPRARLLDLLAGCSAYLVPGVEDFGIAPVEAMAAGKPVVAFAAGGATETVVHGETGLLFSDASAKALADAIQALPSARISSAACRTRAEAFSRARFFAEWRALFARHGVDPSLYAAK